MIVSDDKYHFLVRSKDKGINKNPVCKNLVGIKIDSQLNFSEDLNGIISKTSNTF